MASSRFAPDVRVGDGAPRCCTTCCRQDSQPPSWDDLWRRGCVPASRFSCRAQGRASTMGESCCSDRDRGFGRPPQHCAEGRVSRLLPIGYVTIRDAAEMIAQSMFAGVPDRAIVAKLRQTEGDVADGQALDDAISELWNAVDSGKVQSFIIGSRPDPLKLSAALTRGIPSESTREGLHPPTTDKSALPPV